MAENRKELALFSMLNKKKQIYWYGEESRLITLLESLGLFRSVGFSYTKKLVSSRRKRSYIPVKVQQLESLADEKSMMRPDVIDYYHREKNVVILYDLSTEAITFSGYTSKVLAKFHDLLKEYEIDAERVVLLCANGRAHQQYEIWLRENNLAHFKINLIGYPFYLYEYYDEIRQCEWIVSNKERFYQATQKTVLENKKRTKHFISLNLRPRAHRTALALHLLERGYLEKGEFTYFGDEFADHDSVDNQADRVDFIGHLTCKDRLLSKLDTLNQMTPILLDKDNQNIRKALWERKPGEVDFLFPEGENALNVGLNSYFEIVTETWLTGKENLYLTEKTIRPIIRFQPFIHIGAPGLLAYLRSLGFKTFSPFINETYDAEACPYKRLELIFDEIDRLCSMSIDEVHAMYKQLWPVLLHNQKHFTENMYKVAKKDITENLVSAL